MQMIDHLMKKINTNHLMVEWQLILVILFILGCGEDKLELGIEGKAGPKSPSGIGINPVG